MTPTGPRPTGVTTATGVAEAGPVRRQQVAALVRRWPRTLSWAPAFAGVGAAAGLLVWQADGLADDPVRALMVTRLALLLLVIGSLALLDDVAREATEAVPLSRRWRAGIRCAAVLLVVGPAGGAVALVAMPHLSPDLGVGLAVELGAVLAAGMAVCLFLQRRFGIDEPSQLAAVGLAMVPPGLLVVQTVAVTRWPLLVVPGPGWGAAHWRWLVLLGIALAALVRLTRDP